MRPNIRGLTHDHVDGSMAMRDIILDLYALAGKRFPFASIEQWLTYFRTDPHKDMVAKFGTVTGVLQTEEALRMAGFAYGKWRAEEGYLYAEPKFAPQYHVFEGLTLRSATYAMYTGLKRAETQFGILLLPVVAIGREASPDLGVEIANLVLDYEGMLALDLACDEAGYPPERHFRAYERTFGSKVPRDCHAGEWVNAEPSETYDQRLLANMHTAIDDLQCQSIGHGRVLRKDPELVKKVVDKGIRVAMCPLSNIGCKHSTDVRDPGIDELLDAGACITLDADDDVIFPKLSEVIAQCDEAYDFTAAECRALEENVFRGALDPRVRSW